MPRFTGSKGSRGLVVVAQPPRRVRETSRAASEVCQRSGCRVICTYLTSGYDGGSRDYIPACRSEKKSPPMSGLFVPFMRTASSRSSPRVDMVEDDIDRDHQQHDDKDGFPGAR